MKATISRSALTAALRSVSGAVSARPTVPVLAGVRLAFDADGGLRVSTFDFDTALSVTIATETIPTDAPAPVLVSHRLLSQVLGAASSASVDVDVDERMGRLTVTSGRAEWRLPLMPVDDFPPLPNMPPTVGDVDAATLADAAARVNTAAHRGDELPMLTGIRVEADADSLTLAATDRYRIHSVTIPWRPTEHAMHETDLLQLLVPAAKFTGALQAAAGPLQLSAHGDLIGFTTDALSGTMRLLDAQFPTWRRLMSIPAGNAATRIYVDRDDLVAVLRQVLVVTPHDQPVARVTVAGGELSLSPVSNPEDGDGTAVTDAKIDGADETFAVNVPYLLDAVAALGSPTVELRLTSNTRPIGVCVPDEQTPTVVVMPIRLPG